MKYIFFLLAGCFALQLQAQKQTDNKSAKLSFHGFYTDFGTAQKIRATSLKHVLQNKQWSNPEDMQLGMGITYHRELIKQLDIAGTIDGSFVDYLFKTGATNGSSRFLLDVNVVSNLKLLADRHTVAPYLTLGGGLHFYGGKTGLYIPAGMGLQFNVFNEAFVFANGQYRIAIGDNTNYHFYYSIGIGAAIGKKKKPTPSPAPEQLVELVKQPEPVVDKLSVKNVLVAVADEATGQPLYNVEITLTGADGNIFNGITNTDGKALFKDVMAGNYTVSGRLNKVDATTAAISKDNFSQPGNQVQVSIKHNDPRFTLVGNALDKNAGLPVIDAQVTINNSTQSSAAFATSSMPNGEFRTQLESASDFVVFGKKGGYISNIENLSTKGLNRSATLYVKLELGIEEAKAGQSIVLSKIYFATGQAALNTASSTDLNKLVLFLKDNPATKLEIQGHTDNTGSNALNNLLSQSRAGSVVTFLVKNGIDKNRLTAKGYGSSQPIAENTNEEGRQKNRRVEMKVVE